MSPVTTISYTGVNLKAVKHFANAKGELLTEDVNQNVEEVVLPTEAEEVVEESSSKEPQKGTQEYNFREARRTMDQQNRKIQELEYHLANLQQNALPQEEDPTDGDIITKKQAREMAEQIAAQREAQREYDTAEDRMRLKFRDYDDVVTQENVEEITKSATLKRNLQKSDNPYELAYELIKESHFYNQKKAKPKKNPDAEKIVQNASKPVSSNAIQTRPLATANEFANSSSQERDSLYREMMGYASRRN